MNKGILERALANTKRSMASVFGFSFLANLLLLTSPIFMLQVYDRVLVSRSEETLLGLMLVAVIALLVLLMLETIRNKLLTRISMRFDRELGEETFTELLSRSPTTQPLHDMNTIRQFISSPFVLALFDMPWIPLYLGLVYFLHPMLGHIGLAAVIILFAVALINDRKTREENEKSGQYLGSASRFTEHSVRHKDAAIGMGMTKQLTGYWKDFQQAGLGFLAKGADINAGLGSFAKVFRQFIQVAILAMGAFLTIQDLSTAGVMIAASIITARALAPVEQSIQGWRNLTKCRQAYKSLDVFLGEFVLDKPVTNLPEPQGHITLHNVFAHPAVMDAPEPNEEPLIRNVSLRVEPGTVLGIAGPSGSGKSTLMRLMLGVVPTLRGSVRIDGADLTPENQKQFSPYIGYLPQDIELFNGTIAENIARFSQASDEDIVNASKLSGAHELILSLKDGYETKVGPGGINLSGGQRQRIGMARAIFGQPKMVFLDEPTSNLDEVGTLALLNVVKTLKENGVTVVLIAHQPRLFLMTDNLAVLNNGVLERFGLTRDILEELKPKNVPLKTASSQSHMKREGS